MVRGSDPSGHIRMASGLFLLFDVVRMALVPAASQNPKLINPVDIYRLLSEFEGISLLAAKRAVEKWFGVKLGDLKTRGLRDTRKPRRKIPQKAVSELLIRLGKPDLYLSGHPKSQANHPLDWKLDNRRSQANGKRHETPNHRSLLLDLPTPTHGKLKSHRIWTNPENCPSFFKAAMYMMDSPSRDPKTVIQYARGHAFLAFSDFIEYPRRQKACPFLLSPSGNGRKTLAFRRRLQ